MTAGVLLLLGCVAGDLAAGRPVTTSTAGDVSAITAAARLPDGSVWDAPGTVKLRRGTQLTIDLGEERTIRAVEIQADNDDDYLIEGSVDGGVWRTLWQARGVSGAGLRTRHRALDEPAPARSLRSPRAAATASTPSRTSARSARSPPTGRPSRARTHRSRGGRASTTTRC